MYRIIGIDPASKTGYSILDYDVAAGQITLVVYGLIDKRKVKPLSERLLAIYNSITQVLDRYKPDLMSIESGFEGNNRRTAMVLAEIRAVYKLAATQRSIEIAEYEPSEVRKEVLGKGNADKEEIAAYCQRAFPGAGLEGEADDITDSIITGIAAVKGDLDAMR